jgi:hypothetical protein
MRAKHILSGIAGLALAGSLLALPATALAEAMTYSVALDGASEVPAVATTGSGVAEVTFDPATKLLTWTVTFDGLSGDAAAAHFHGPAAPGTNAGVAVPIDITVTPITGSATLTDEQAAEFTAGLWYVNIHTAANKGGEIRGWVLAE